MPSEPHSFAGLIPEMLIQSIKERRCVLFVGAGISARVRVKDGKNLPLWKELLERMIDWSVKHRIHLQADPVELRSVLKKGRLLVVAEELQQCIAGQLGQCLAEILHSGTAKPSDAHRAICKTNWVSVLTSNYDALIEGAYALESSGILPPAHSHHSVNQAINCLRNSTHFVFKVHGDLNSPESIILGNRDYSRLLYLNPAYRSFLETVFSTYTVLFVGFGNNDPDLNAVVDRLSTVYERSISQHYILVSEKDFSGMEKRRLLEDKRLDCITYEHDSTHSQVEEFLKAVAYRSSPNIATPKPFKSERITPKAFISGSHFDIQLLRQIAEIASEAGFEVWFAESNISAGDNIAHAVSKAINDTDCIIVVLTENAAVSSWVHLEVERAWVAKKKLLPIRVGDSPLPANLNHITYYQVNDLPMSPRDKIRILASLIEIAASIREEKSDNTLR